MNRRSFLRLLAGTALAPVLPNLDGLLPEPIRASSALERMPIQEFDYGNQVGLGAKKVINGTLYRQAILLPVAVWEQATEEQREEFWGYVERALDRNELQAA